MSTKPCPTCGELLPANAMFCGNCGTRLQPAAPAAQANAGPVQGGPAPFPGPPPAGQPLAPFPPAPSQPGVGAAPQGANAPPGGPGFPSQPGGLGMPPPQVAAPPPGFGPPPQPGMPPPGFAGPPQPGGPGGPAPVARALPPRKRRAGLIVAIVLVLLVVVIGGAVGSFLLIKGKTPNSATTPGADGGANAPTATTSASSGFQAFQNSAFRILYPTGWLSQQMPVQQGTEQKFLAPSGAVTRSLTVDVFDKTRPPKDEDDALCLGYSGNPTAKVTPTTVTLAGQQWTREDCAARNVPGAPTLKATVESVIYKGKLYTISYTSSPDATFAADRSKYYTPMEQSFAFRT